MAGLKAQIKRLYVGKKYSGVEIARHLNLPIRQVYRILEKASVRRRKTHESNLLRFERQAPSFTLRKNFSTHDKLLLTAGIMLYWAEGASHKNRCSLDFANSDPDMIKVYLVFLRRVCGVDEGRLRIYLYCYANQNIEALKRFWTKITGVSLRQFTQPYVRKDFKKEKEGKMPYGLVHVRYADKKLYRQFEVWQQKIALQLSRVGGGVDNRSGL
ncbi:MAG: hypothetical protein HYS44_00295 [Candidatus Niyogibacteria bacterium]|nr:hypothetical protein [Candidatus Niyogibacteria bacterium]